MASRNKAYNSPQITLHWAIAFLITANYFVSDGMGSLLHKRLEDSNSNPGWLGNIHVYVGLTVLCLVVIRLIVRLMSTIPKPISTGKASLDKAAKWAHGLLYTLIFLVPLFGASAWYFGFGFMGDVHVVAVNIMMAIALLHALAAFYHHYFLKDEVLLRMLGRR
jgi:cytochrome b561